MLRLGSDGLKNSMFSQVEYIGKRETFPRRKSFSIRKLTKTRPKVIVRFANENRRIARKAGLEL